MNRIEQELLEVLKTIEGNGSFAVSGVHELVVPGLHIKGIGELGFPLNPKQIKDLIKGSRKAPFGKGSKTITDTNVRSAWEIDAAKLSFKNKSWKKFIDDITEDIKVGLGVEDKSVDLSLYKLLIYEEGDFFLPHKDSEKEKGMFATLVIALPSEHTGGELIVRFDGRDTVIDFSGAASTYRMPFAAFYADCEHEIKPVTSGYRVCLVYNLLQSSNDTPIVSPEFGEQTAEMSVLLKSWIGNTEVPKVLLLEHEYTPANYTLADLKGHDRPRAEALVAAAESAGFFARLGLVTEYQMGQLEDYDDYGDYYSRRRRRYDYDEYDEGNPTDGTMGEIYEHRRYIEHWAKDDNPGLGNLSIDEDNVLTNIEMGEGEPSEKAAEGYTGNAGMTMEYWYHYGAVVIWRKDKHFEMLQQRPMNIQLDWLKFYAKNWNDDSLNAATYTKQILGGLHLQPDEYGNKDYLDNDFTGFAAALVRINDKKILKKELAKLEEFFAKIDLDTWHDLIHTYKGSTFKTVFENVGHSNNIDALHHLLHILETLIEQASKPSDFVSHQIQQLPDYLNKSELHILKTSNYTFYTENELTRTDKIKNIISVTSALSKHKADDTDWIKNTADRLTKSMPRDYVNEVLFPILSQHKNEGHLLRMLYKATRKDFQKRTAQQPAPPKDWTRAVPKSRGDQDVWEMLASFLQSPTKQVFDYVKNESYRKNVRYAIRRTTVDLKTETIKKGRPYTLRITKTQAAYELKLEQWKEDVQLLEELEKVGE